MDAQLIANNPQEEVLIKIRSIQRQNTTAKQCAKIQNLEKRISRLFVKLVRSQYGISKNQLLKFSDDQIESLQESLCIQLKTRAIFSIITFWTLGLLIPIVGWSYLMENIDGDSFPLSYSYRRACNKLRNMLGDKYFSAERFREIDP